MIWLCGFADIVSRTPVYTTPDAHDPSRPAYSNAIVAITSDIEKKEIGQLMKGYEVTRGRIAGNSVIPIDLDLVCQDNVVLRSRDYTAPYFVEGLYLLSSISKADGGRSNE